MSDPTRPPMEALSAPLGELVASVGRGVADAQRELDAATVEAIRDLSAAADGTLAELRALGWRPTWYQIPEAEAEISVALSVTAEQTGDVRGRVKLYGAPMDASYTNRFGYTLTAQSKLRFRVVPVPAPVGAENARFVPALGGKTLDEAAAILDAMGIPYTVEGSTARGASVVATSVPAGMVLVDGATLVLTTVPPKKLPPTLTITSPK